MKAEVVLIPGAARGHLPAALEFAKLAVGRSDSLSITVLLIKIPFDDQNLVAYDSLIASFSSDRIKFVHISPTHHDDVPGDLETNPIVLYERFIESHRPQVRNAAVSVAGSGRLAGFVLDMMSTSMADVAEELGVPTYVFWACGTGCLGLHVHIQREIEERFDLDADHSFPGFDKPVPGSILPSVLFNSAAPVVHGAIKRLRESRGVLVNSSAEIEPRALQALISDSSLPVYTVGPVVHVPEITRDESENIVAWLDGQPPESVIFLCFGSNGVFRGDQVREISAALESSGVRFLWSLGKCSSDPEKILPEGFLGRTAGRGRVIRWAPQAAVLGHVAVGGFVSHCGWNSVLESLWFGVPIATWPLYAEQQLNAFEMVAELGLAVEVKMDFKFGFGEDDANRGDVVLISAEVIEAAIGKVMEGESEIRKRVKEMSVKCRNAVIPGGSSFSSLDRFLSDIFENLNFN